MAFTLTPTRSRSPLTPFFFPSSSFPFKPSTVISPKLPLNPLKIKRSIVFSSFNQPTSPITSEQAILDVVAGFVADEKNLPAVRTFENDLTRFSIVGPVDFQQALTAAAADRGESAEEHISSGTDAMVVETVFPGGDERSTVSTRLFLPAKKVKEKAVKLMRSFKKDVFDGTISKNILAMTFRQVVLQQIWNFELALFRPGTERNMEDLENSREVPVSLTLSSSDERVISEIGEVVCLAVLENTEGDFRRGSVNQVSNKLFTWFNKRKVISSRDSSVILYDFFEHEILANAEMLLEKFNMERGNYKPSKATNLNSSWWMLPTSAKLEKIGGPEFCAWISECVPSYMLKVDASKLGDVNFEGWKKTEENSWEVVLTHSQLVSLADILDMYYEDVFTLPNKRLSCHTVTKSSDLLLHKGTSLLKKLSVVVASGVFIITISVLGKLYLPHLPSKKIYIQENSETQLSGINSAPRRSVELSKLKSCCVSVVERIKDYYDLSGDISISEDRAWIGELPAYLKNVGDIDSSTVDNSSSSTLPEANEEEMKALQDTASYQIVLSSDGKIIGFQPTSRVAVNNWAANPLAKDLYGGKKLSPGLLEPGLKIKIPNEVVVLELLMSVNPKSHFALARPVEL